MSRICTQTKVCRVTVATVGAAGGTIILAIMLIVVRLETWGGFVKKRSGCVCDRVERTLSVILMTPMLSFTGSLPMAY